MGSPSTPSSGQRGTPELAWTMPPNCHPRTTQPAGPPNDFGTGTSQRASIVKVRLKLKSESPHTIRRSHHGMVGLKSAEKLSPAKLPEEVSMVLPQVNELRICKPWLMRFSTCTWRAL